MLRLDHVECVLVCSSFLGARAREQFPSPSRPRLMSTKVVDVMKQDGGPIFAVNLLQGRTNGIPWRVSCFRWKAQGGLSDDELMFSGLKLWNKWRLSLVWSAVVLRFWTLARRLVSSLIKGDTRCRLFFMSRRFFF